MLGSTRSEVAEGAVGGCQRAVTGSAEEGLEDTEGLCMRKEGGRRRRNWMIVHEEEGGRRRRTRNWRWRRSGKVGSRGREGV